MKCICFQKSRNSLSLSFHWSFHAFHKCALFIFQVVRLTGNLSNCALHRIFFLASSGFFVPLCLKAPSENASRTIFLLQWLGLLQVPSQLNDDSLLKIFSKDFLWNCIQLLSFPTERWFTSQNFFRKIYYEIAYNCYPSQLNDDSLLKIFFERFIMKLHTIVIPNKQTNAKVTRLAKKYFKTQSNTFLIKLKCHEVFREN